MIRIGDVELSRVEELHAPAFAPRELLPDWTDEAVARHLGWLVPDYYDPQCDQLVMTSQSWVIRTGRHTILIDTCIGADKERPQSAPVFHRAAFPYLANLTAAGVRPEDVDYVMCTHLHTDHVGWNTRLENGRWTPTFPNARYLFSDIDLEALRPAPGKVLLGDDAQIYADSVLPILETGQAVRVRGAEQVADVLTIEPTPGHSAGHIAARLSSRGEQALFVGDAIHHPIQVYYPDWSTPFCADPLQARSTRRRILEEAAEEGLLLCPAHFGAGHCGVVTQNHDGFAFTSVEGTKWGAWGR